MTGEVTFRQLEAQQPSREPGMAWDSSLSHWYDLVRDKRIDDFSDEDLSIASRQALHLDYVVPAAIARLQHDPLAGEKYDGELIVALKSVPDTYWATNSLHANKLKQILLSVQNSVESALSSDIADLLPKLG
jgi:hypothetical protein